VVARDFLLLSGKKTKRRKEERRGLSSASYLLVAHVAAYADEGEDCEYEDVAEDCSCKTPLAAEVVCEDKTVTGNVGSIATRSHSRTSLEALQENHDDDEAHDCDAETDSVVEELRHTTAVHLRSLFFHVVYHLPRIGSSE